MCRYSEGEDNWLDLRTIMLVELKTHAMEWMWGVKRTKLGITPRFQNSTMYR